jgi:glutaredoxin 3
MQNSIKEIPEEISKHFKLKKVVIFSFSNCVYCTKASELLNNLNVKPDIVKIDRINSLKNNNNKEIKDLLIKQSNNKDFPKIYIGTNYIGGYSDLYDLFTQNKLFEILKRENIDFIEEDFY